MITIIIPYKDRGKERIMNVLKHSKNDLIDKVIIVDYGSEKPLDLNVGGVLIQRISNKQGWNKAHAINCAAKHVDSEYIMTLDADILLGPDFYYALELFLDGTNFIYSKEVKRIKGLKNTEDWKSLLKRSTSWTENGHYANELNHTGTGGVQVFPTKWFKDIRGIDENLFFYGGMDNITIIDAKNKGLNIVQLNKTILHLEHKDLKENNLGEDYEFAKFVKKDRTRLINAMIQSPDENNPGFWGEVGRPNSPMYQEYKKQFKKWKEAHIHDVELELFQSPEIRIMVVPINNTGQYPTYFANALFNSVMFTKKAFTNTDIVEVNGCDVNHIRNLAVDLAIENGYDYLIQMDTDHKYPNSFILQLLSHEKDFVTGLTMNRAMPLTLTQFKKISNNDKKINRKDNVVIPNGELQKIEASGPVGMCMKVSALKKMSRPWFKMDYHGERGITVDSGGDFHFCKAIKKAGLDLWCDTSLEFSHHNTVEISQKGLYLGGNQQVKEVEKKEGKIYFTHEKLPKSL